MNDCPAKRRSDSQATGSVDPQEDRSHESKPQLDATNAMGNQKPGIQRGLRRWLYIVLGSFFVALATIGALLPVLPTTPFLILASYFFIRSSEPLNRWLLSSRLFGPTLRTWNQHRGLTRKAKLHATSAMLIAFVIAALSAWSRYWITISTGVLIAIGIAFVLTRRTVCHSEDPPRQDTTPPVNPEID